MSASDLMSASDIARRCTATSKAKQQQCGRSAIPGGNVCTYHGGKAPQVQRKAAERLAALVDPAIGALQDLLAKKNRHAPSRLGAAKDVLDRNGFKPPDKVEHGGPNGAALSFTLQLNDRDRDRGV